MPTSHVTSLRVAVRQGLTLTLPMLLALAALLAWGGREVVFVGTPDPSQDRAVAINVWAQDSIDAQLADLRCDKTQHLTANVAVRNSAKDNAGNVQFDTTVVRKVALEQAIADAQAGRVWVVGWCS